MARGDYLVILVYLDSQVCQERQEIQVIQAKKDLPVHQDQEVSQDQWVYQVFQDSPATVDILDNQ